MKKLLHRIAWPFVIRGKLIRRIKAVTSERDYFKNSLQWGENNTAEDEKFLQSRIDSKNDTLHQLRALL